MTGDSVRALKTQMGANNTIQTWLAATNETVDKTINIPAPRIALANSLDPDLVRTINTAQGNRMPIARGKSPPPISRC
ncbi:MAG: hypothetical protein HY070_00620 [Chloroflexi bacterium]|nr:hypothetical protein [Chloroflexota bacterium]